jgi:dipeptide/tripeptide permease
MFVGVLVFMMGEKHYRVVPASGVFTPWVVCKVMFGAVVAKFQGQSPEGVEVRHWLDYSRPHYGPFVDEVRKFLSVVVLLIPIPVYKALYSQKDTTWQNQLTHMNKLLIPFSSMRVPVESFGQINPILVVMLAPVMAKFLYPFLQQRGIKFGSLERMIVGYFLGIVSFVIAGLVQVAVDKNNHYIATEDTAVDDCVGCLSGWWQFPQYFIITVSEILLFISGLEFAYTHVGKALKSTTTAFWLLTTALGNFLVRRSCQPKQSTLFTALYRCY